MMNQTLMPYHAIFDLPADDLRVLALAAHIPRIGAVAAAHFEVRDFVKAAVGVHGKPFDIYVGKPRGLSKGPERPPQRVSWIEPMFVVRDKQERVRVRQAHRNYAPTSPRRPDRNAGPLLYVSGAARGCLLGSGGGYGRGGRQRGARRSISTSERKRRGIYVNFRQLQPVLREGCGLRRDG